MQPENVLRPAGGRGDLVDIQVGRVAGQNSTAPGVLIDLPEQVLLDVHVLEGRLDDDIGLGERRNIGADAVKLVGKAVAMRLVELASPHTVVEDAFDILPAACRTFFVALDHLHRHAGEQHRHGNARSHGAAADDRSPVERPWRTGFQFRDLADLAVGEKHMDQRLALRRGHEFHEQLALALQPFREGQFRGCDHRFKAQLRRQLALGFLLDCLPQLVEEGLVSARSLDLVRQLARPAGRQLLGHNPPSEGEPGRKRIVAFVNRVNDTQLQRLWCRNMASRCDDFGRCFDACQARQTLRAPGARAQAQKHLRKADTCGFDGNAVMAGEGGFQSAAERGPVDGADNRLVEILDGVYDLSEARCLHRLAEFPNVGAGDERAPLADDNRNIRRVPGEFLGGIRQTLTDRVASRIHRRIVDGDNGNGAGFIGQDFIGYCFGHHTHR